MKKLVGIPPGTYEVVEILDPIRHNEKAQETKFTGIVQPNARKTKIICRNWKKDFTAPNSLEVVEFIDDNVGIRFLDVFLNENNRRPTENQDFL